MKKKLESELISIAHRVLKLKNRSETVLLQREAKKLYEQLTILRFYEENFETLKNDISQEQLEEKLEQMSSIASVETKDLEEKVEEVANVIETPEVIEEVVKEKVEVVSEKEELIVEEVVEEKPKAKKEEKLLAFEPETPSNEREATADEINKIVAEMSGKKEEKKSNPTQQIAFEDLLGPSYVEPEFIRVNDVPKEIEKVSEITFEKKEEVEVIVEETSVKEVIKENADSSQEAEKQEVKAKSLNDKLTNGISFGLNDRIAFEKKLFNGSADDFNRVISQLNTFDSFEEASSFITDFVKPDYKNWEGKEEFETRFLEIIEKKFN